MLNELFNRGAVEPVGGIFASGYVWAPWFFMVFGFQLLVTELNVQVGRVRELFHAISVGGIRGMS